MYTAHGWDADMRKSGIEKNGGLGEAGMKHEIGDTPHLCVHLLHSLGPTK